MNKQDIYSVVACEVSFVRTWELLLHKAAKSTTANNEKPQNSREREKHLSLSGLFSERHFSSIFILFLFSTVCVSICEFADSIWSGRDCYVICVFHICDLVATDAVSPHRNKVSSHGALGRRTVTTQPFEDKRVKRNIEKDITPNLKTTSL